MNILEQANKLTSEDRQQDYGHPYHDFSRTAKLWTALLGKPITARQVGLCMIALKLSRQVNKPKRDNLIDIAGYARTTEMIDEFENDNPNDRPRMERPGAVAGQSGETALRPLPDFPADEDLFEGSNKRP